MPNRILVVDDDVSILEMLTEMLNEHGFEVSTTAQGEAVFELIDQYHPDLILLDAMLGGVDGKTICAAVKTFTDTKNIPVIMLSGNYRNAAIMYEHHCPDDFVIKPFDMDSLINKIKQQLAA